MTIISDFLSKVQSIHATGNATEHSYRSAFEALFAAFGVTALRVEPAFKMWPFLTPFVRTGPNSPAPA